MMCSYSSGCVKYADSPFCLFSVYQKSLWRAQAFNPETGEPARCVEMAGWPKLESVSETFGSTLRRALVEAFWATSTTEGVSVLFDRCATAAAWLCL